MSGESARANASGKADDYEPSEFQYRCLECDYDMGPLNPRQLCGKSCCWGLGPFGPFGPLGHQFSDESDEAETRDTNIEVGKVGVPDIKKDSEQQKPKKRKFSNTESTNVSKRKKL